MDLVTELGGISIVVDSLTGIMSTGTAVPLFGAASGVLSWFSSTSGVVMPTMIPMIPELVSVIAVNPVVLVLAVVAVANCAGFSPASTAGSQILANYTAQAQLSAQESNKVFIRLFGISVIGLCFMVALGALGFYGLFN